MTPTIRSRTPPPRSSRTRSACASAPLHAGDERSVQRQRERGKGLARERLERAPRPGLAGRAGRLRAAPQLRTSGWRSGGPTATAWSRATARCTGARSSSFSQDFTVFGGSLGEAYAEKICKVMDLAVRFGCPVIGINDSGGARIQEGVVALGGYAEIFRRNVMASGVVPQISLVMGPCAGGAVYSPAITDFVLMTRGTSHMFITGPEVVRTVTGEEVSFEDLGGADTHAQRSGVAHLVADDEDELCDEARYLLTFLPQNNLEPVPHVRSDDPRDRCAPELDTIIPDSPTQPYDIKAVIRARRRRRRLLRDPRALRREHRLRLRAARRPRRRHRRQPAAGARRRARHRLLGQGRALRAHLRRLRPAARDVRRRPGFLPGTAQEWNGIIRHGAKLLYAYCEATVAEARGDHAQGLRRRLRRDELQARRRRLQLRLADGRGGGDGPGGRRQHRLPQRSSPRPPIRSRGASS